MKVTIKSVDPSGKEEVDTTVVKDKEMKDDDVKRKPYPGPIVPCPKLLTILATVFGARCRHADRE